MRRKNTPKGPIKIKSTRKLHPEEIQLWQKVKCTINPQAPKINHEKDMEDFLIAFGDAKKISPPPVSVIKPTTSISNKAPHRNYKVPSYSPPISQPKTVGNLNAPIDNSTVRKISKGRLSIDARIDLHGMTQVQAHHTLLNFVQDSYNASLKIVLVITGKGRISEGVLRNAVPNWLSENMFSTYISGFRTAHASHGGSGALYVRIRKNKH